MSASLFSLSRRVALIAIAAVTVGACAEIRQVTYPPDFRYIDRAEVQSTMAELGSRIWEMDEILAANPKPTPEQRLQVLDLLTEIQSFASTLDPKGKATNHLLIDSHLDAFLEQVEYARLSLAMEPPSFYRAGMLSGSCMGCHQYRR